MAGLVSLALWGAAQVGANMFICPEGRAWTRVHSGVSTVVMERGEEVARPEDGLFTCDTPHTIGPFVIHRDLGCYCAPRQMSAAQIGDFVGGLCAVDTLQPTPNDVSSSCRYGRCSTFVDLEMKKKLTTDPKAGAEAGKRRDK
jgi:hypothetical protein